MEWISRLGATQRRLVLLNVAGGTAVLASYAVALALSPDVRAGLWGGVPDAWRPLYTVNMFLAAAGYFPFTFRLLFRTGEGAFRAATGLPYGALLALYALVLVPSALWLPLTAWMIEAPSGALWVAIRLVLFGVGAGSLGLLAATARLARREGGALSWLAFAGTLPFTLQTLVLDALVWPVYFPASLGLG